MNYGQVPVSGTSAVNGVVVKLLNALFGMAFGAMLFAGVRNPGVPTGDPGTTPGGT